MGNNVNISASGSSNTLVYTSLGDIVKSSTPSRCLKAASMGRRRVLRRVWLSCKSGASLQSKIVKSDGLSESVRSRHCWSMTRKAK